MSELVENNKLDIKKFREKVLIATNIENDRKHFLKTKVVNKVNEKEIKKRTYTVKKIIKKILAEIDNGNISVDKENMHIITYWRNYTKNFSEDAMLNKQTDDDLFNLLNDKKELFIYALEKRENKNYLLMDKKISPEILSFRDEDVCKSYRNIILNIKNYTSGDFISVGIVNPGQGLFLNHLLKNIQNIKEVDLIGRTTLSIKDLRKEYNNIKFTKWKMDENYILGEYVGKFNYLFMPNVVHHFKNIQKELELLSMTLKKSGMLYLTDFVDVDPVSRLVAIFFEDKKASINDDKKNGFFYKNDYLEKVINSLVTKPHDSYIIRRGNVFEACLMNNLNYKDEIDLFAKENEISKCNIKLIYDKENTLTKENIEKLNDGLDILKHEYGMGTDSKTANIQKLTNLWKKNLGIDDENFGKSNYFELGGDSLLATKLVVAINKEFHCELSLTDIFSNAYFQEMLKLIEDKKDNLSIIEGEI
ncbi:MAG: acyl carrier protein [Peptoniphilus harei]|uniref:acyl carrier protein n=1 Tax=Peptoniphilus harei TaxID=54005 RepID=UPI0025515B54|nr:acyl carrier protein [Peptoniphilus harei]MDK7755726.1 acyl carrier protein [Peptoniphilus harei]MDK7761218.1 acyl carrier protein [Peptoniphilus harei]MDK8271486.1 acyl carrier protein [Peptoniphilus harei]MDK8339985.1 acyl carrier protein [Peptoniphilus harei]